MALCLILGGCFLPPPAEDKPLTGELDDAFQADPTAAPEARLNAEVGRQASPEAMPGDALRPSNAQAAADSTVNLESEAAASSPEGAPGGAPEEVARGASPEAAVADLEAELSAELAHGMDEEEAISTLVVEESSGASLELVGDATETVAGTAPQGAGVIDPLAVERDTDADPPVGVESPLQPKDIGSTVSESNVDSASERAADRTADSRPPSSGSRSGGANPASPGASEPASGASASTQAQEGPLTLGSYETDDGGAMVYEIGGPVGRSAGGGSAGVSVEPTMRSPESIVFIHGWCGNRSQWRGHMETLIPDSRVLSVDLLGHGDSLSKGRDEWTIPRYGRDVAGLIEALNLEEVVLVGHAMGGQVALEVALRSPDRIIGVIGVESLHELNVDPKQSADSEELKDYLQAFKDDFPGEFAKFIESAAHPDTGDPLKAQIARDAAGCEKDVAIKLIKHFQTRDLKDVVRAIECPVRCINSKMFTTDIKGNRVLLPGFDAELMDGAGFWPHLEAPGAFQSKLVIQLSKLVAPKKLAEPATLTGVRPVVICEDMEEMVRFYQRNLRFEVAFRQPQDPELPATLVTLKRDGQTLQLQALSSLTTDLPDVVGVARGGQVLSFFVTDLASERERLEPDVKLEIQYRELDTGSKQTVLRDPMDNVIVLQQAARRE